MFHRHGRWIEQHDRSVDDEHMDLVRESAHLVRSVAEDSGMWRKLVVEVVHVAG